MQELVTLCIKLAGLTQLQCKIHTKATGMGLFHPSGTTKMGPASDHMACVDRDLKVHGLEGLRVSDLGVTPLLPRYVVILLPLLRIC